LVQAIDPNSGILKPGAMTHTCVLGSFLYVTNF